MDSRDALGISACGQSNESLLVHTNSNAVFLPPAPLMSSDMIYRTMCNSKSITFLKLEIFSRYIVTEDRFEKTAHLFGEAQTL